VAGRSSYLIVCFYFVRTKWRRTTNLCCCIGKCILHKEQLKSAFPLCMHSFAVPLSSMRAHTHALSLSRACALPQKHAPCSQLLLRKFLKSPFYKNDIQHIFWRAIIERNPPPGGVSYLLCSLIKKREQEDPPRSTWYKFFEGGPLTHGS